MSAIVFAFSFLFIYLTKGKLEKTKVTLIFNAQLPETTKQYVTLYRCFVLFYKPKNFQAKRNWLLSERSTSSFQFKRRTCYTLAVFSTTEGWSCLGESASHPPSGVGWLLSGVGHKLLTHQQFRPTVRFTNTGNQRMNTARELCLPVPTTVKHLATLVNPIGHPASAFSAQQTAER